MELPDQLGVNICWGSWHILSHCSRESCSNLHAHQERKRAQLSLHPANTESFHLKNCCHFKFDRILSKSILFVFFTSEIKYLNIFSYSTCFSLSLLTPSFPYFSIKAWEFWKFYIKVLALLSFKSIMKFKSIACSLCPVLDGFVLATSRPVQR